MSFDTKVKSRYLVIADDLPDVSHANGLKHKLAQAAQKVYDEWDQSDEEQGDPELGFGGICQDIAEAMAEILSQTYEVGTVDSNGVGEQHVWCVIKTAQGVYEVDISPHVYETGGGYHWKKKPDVVFQDHDVVIHKVSSDPDEFESMTEQ